jgi:hypothetical protein
MEKIFKTILSENQTNLAGGTALAFLHYPFKGIKTLEWEFVNLANEMSIGAMKAYALGRRSKWKDYVDLYFLLKKFKLNEIVEVAKNIYREKFSEKLFREQLAFFDDIDYSESLNYVTEEHPTDDEIKNNLSTKASNIQ